MKPDAFALAVTLRTLAAGLLGGGVFALLSVPIPWLSGSMIVVAAVAMSGRAVYLPGLLCDGGLLLAGLTMGSTVTPDAVRAIGRYPLSLIGLALGMWTAMLASRWVLERFYGWDRQTALLASVPGALSTVMALAAGSTADVRRVAIVQAVRLFVLVGVIPPLVTATTRLADLPAPAPSGAVEIAGLVAASIAVTAFLHRVRMANPVFLGGMITSTIAHAADIATGALPDAMVIAGFVVIGVYAGLRFDGTNVRMLVRILLPSMLALAATLLVSGLVALAVHWATGIRLGEVLVAFAPGGVEAMTVIGAALGLDTLYISTHHVLRALALNILTPVIAAEKLRA